MTEGAKERLRSPRRIPQDATIEPGRRYCLMAINGQEYAYEDPADYLRALGRAWSAGLDPEPRPAMETTRFRGPLPREE